MSARAGRAAGRLARAARAVRLCMAAAVLVAASFGFLAAGAAADAVGRVMAAWQIFPATVAAVRILAGGAVIGAGVIVILLLSALFGRWYCAALCPLGTLQDLGSWLGRRRRRYRKPANAARAVSAVAVLALALLGAMSIASWLDPWSLFSRFLSYDLQPLARLAVRADIPGAGPLTLIPGAAAMAAIVVMAVLRGRWFCNTLCPVGSLLGLLNRFAPFRLRMEESTCVSCGACVKACPASCIDPRGRRLDESRCVYCLSCVGACPSRAIRYGRPRARPTSAKPAAARGPAMSRSRFLMALGGGAAALAFSAWPGRALAARLSPAHPATVPPGARSLARLLETCTACGLCTARCPSRVLQPSRGALGPRGILVPRLDYAVSYCQFECTICLDVCPSGALVRMPLERKKLTKIGDAALVRDKCIVFTDKTKCGACAEHCPTGAVTMVESPTGIPEPEFHTATCIGCGACHHACPVRPDRAITVSGLAVHGTASPPPAAAPPGNAREPILRGHGPPGEKASGAGGADFPF